jgi:uncharacterized surface protein with fasciclin (FAS1) repeats
MQRRDFVQLVLLAAGAPALAACGGGTTGGAAPEGSVLGVARSNGLTRFAGAAEDAGLGEVLAGPGPYTVFAPSNRAFAAASLPRDKALERLLAYHVVPGEFTADFLTGVDVNYTTAAGSSLNVDGTGDTLRVNGARVISPDLAAGNGVVHVIDRVLDPR